MLELPSPQSPASRLSKNPNTEKSPCVIVAIATEVQSVPASATAATIRFRHRVPPNPIFPFCIVTPRLEKPSVTSNPSPDCSKASVRQSNPHSHARKLRTRLSYHSPAYLVKKGARAGHKFATVRK